MSIVVLRKETRQRPLTNVGYCIKSQFGYRYKCYDLFWPMYVTSNHNIAYDLLYGICNSIRTQL